MIQKRADSFGCLAIGIIFAFFGTWVLGARVLKAVKIWMNERWLEFQIRAGALILDIGPTISNGGGSPFNKMGAEILSIPSRVVDLLVK